MAKEVATPKKGFVPLSEDHAELVEACKVLTRGAKRLALADLIGGKQAFEKALAAVLANLNV